MHVGRVEWIEAAPPEPVPMRHVGEGISARKMWHGHMQRGAGTADAMDLFERLGDVVDVLEDIVRMHLVKGFRVERPRPAIEIVNNVSADIGTDVEIHGLVHPLLAATDVQASRRGAHRFSARINEWWANHRKGRTDSSEG